jgi:ParB family transcriptional regulator, chromosome partitioning protein
LARPDFRSTAARRLSEERELSPNIINLLSPEGTQRPTGVRHIPVDRIKPNPGQPRMTFDEDALAELAASIKEHGVLQPVLVRPKADEPQTYEIVAGERRWRATRMAGIATIPALVEEIDDDTALEIAIIENLQREDLSPLEEAVMYERMVTDHGYSVRKLAQKIGKDKGYVENRLRLADAPVEIKQLVSLRKDTLSHAYELLKVEDPRKRRRLAEQVARGELTLIKLHERVEGRPRTVRADTDIDQVADEEDRDEVEFATAAPSHEAPSGDNALMTAKASLSGALEDLAAVLGPQAISQIDATDRQNLAKYLTIAKLRLENAIAALRIGESRSN